jgi:predicted nucleic acid-binding Zn ribbon protein
MATYLYETIPGKPGEEPVTFEVQQSMKDAPLTKHPETGLPAVSYTHLRAHET